MTQPCTMQVELVYDAATLAIDASQGSPCVPGPDLAASSGSLVCNWWSTPGLVLLNALTDGRGPALQSSQAGPQLRPLAWVALGGLSMHWPGMADNVWQRGELGTVCCSLADATHAIQGLGCRVSWAQRSAGAQPVRADGDTGCA